MGRVELSGTVVCDGTTGGGGSRDGPGVSQAAFPKGGEGMFEGTHEGAKSGGGR